MLFLFASNYNKMLNLWIESSENTTYCALLGLWLVNSPLGTKAEAGLAESSGSCFGGLVEESRRKEEYISLFMKTWSPGRLQMEVNSTII